MGTEKMTKKPAPDKKPTNDGKYHKTTQAEVAKFMGGQKLITGAAKRNNATENRAAGTSKVLGPDEQPNPENVAEANALGEVFAIVNPIPSCVGPIGQFQVNIDHFPLHPAVCLFGKRRTGKTFTLRDFMAKAFKDIPFGIVLTQTHQNGFWQVRPHPCEPGSALGGQRLHRHSRQ